MDNMLLDKIQIPGVTLRVRDKEEYMNASLEKLAKQLAKKEMATRNTGVIDEAEAMERFYQNTNRKD